MSKQCNKKSKDKDNACKKFQLIKAEFSKVFCTLVALCIGGYAIWSGIKYYQLTELAIQLSYGQTNIMPPTELAVVCVSGILVSLLSYLIYTASLKVSLNRNNLKIDDCGDVSAIMRGDVEGVIEAIGDNITITEEESSFGPVGTKRKVSTKSKSKTDTKQTKKKTTTAKQKSATTKKNK